MKNTYSKTRVGIVGSGWIAEKMAITLKGMGNAERYAIASRDINKAEAFRKQWGFEKAYGSYEEMMKDPNVDLVYIATPHSHHYDNAKLAITYGKAVLCEKAFTANAKEAKDLIRLAHEKGVFITEAIWTRYMPLSLKIMDLLKDGVIGRPRLLTATLGYPMEFKERIVRPELCGGALLDLGVYSINFARMFFGDDIADIRSLCWKNENGMDINNAISILYKDGRMANIQSTACCVNDRQGIISGETGYIVVDNINNPQVATVYDADHNVVAEYKTPEQITGYEYQVTASIDAISKGWIESPYMPHEETIKVMEMMDALRKEWGVVYPNDSRVI